jgi:hypothetical protein
MKYTSTTSASNSALRFNLLEINTRRQPSLACRLIASRFRVSLDTAAILAEAAGLPQSEEA